MKRPILTYWLIALTGIIITQSVILALVIEGEIFWTAVGALVWALICGSTVRDWRRYAAEAESDRQLIISAQGFFTAVADPEVRYIDVEVERDEGGVVLHTRSYPPKLGPGDVA